MNSFLSVQVNYILTTPSSKANKLIQKYWIPFIYSLFTFWFNYTVESLLKIVYKFLKTIQSSNLKITALSIHLRKIKHNAKWFDYVEK